MAEWVFVAVAVIVGGLGLWAMVLVGWGFSKGIQPSIDDFFGSHPRKRKPEKEQSEEKA